MIRRMIRWDILLTVLILFASSLCFATVYYPDYSETDQGVAGNGGTVYSYINTIGANTATLKFQHNSRGVATAYIFSTDVSIPANIKVVIEKGAVLIVENNNTLTLTGSFEAGSFKVFGGDGSIKFANSEGVTRAAWWYDGLDIGAAVNSAIEADCLSISLPAGILPLYTQITCPAYVNLSGAGMFNTVIKKKADINAIEVTGGYGILKDFSLDSEGLDTTNGIGLLMTNASRTTVDNVYITNMKSHGIDHVKGNLTLYGNIYTINNGGHGFFCDGTNPNSIAYKIAFLDTRNNNLDGFHIQGPYSKNVVAYIVSQSNSGKGVYVDTVNANMVIYSESNINDNIELGANAKGNYINAANGTVTDNSGSFSYNTIYEKSHTVGKRSLIAYMKRLKFRDEANYIGHLTAAFTADKVFTFEMGGSSAASQTIQFTNAVEGKVTNVLASGSITAKGYLSPQNTAAKIYSGSGSPEGIIASNVGSIYLNTQGGQGTSLYVKESDSGQKTGWVAK